MPRPLATGHADSLQQRARFYGYKQRYLGYCRVYLQGDVRVAFEKYVEHEADIHHSLDGQRGYELKAWARQFILDSSMKPTRKGVIGIPLQEFLASGWIEPAAAHIDARCVESNREVFLEFLGATEGIPSWESQHRKHIRTSLSTSGSSRRPTFCMKRFRWMWWFGTSSESCRWGFRATNSKGPRLSSRLSAYEMRGRRM
jgi:hypothetical protein